MLDMAEIEGERIMYHYEVLGDERFQQFCQALIAATFPNAQCLPVGQPDGGRDGFLLRSALEQAQSKKKDLIVFQVKFAKSFADGRSERERIEDLIKKEIPKIERLKARGLKKYYLITNLQGTSHLNSGSIDRVNDILSDIIGMDAYCWWRDDLDRRLDGNTNIKWSYPDILKATDLLGALVAGQLGEDEERRRGAIRAYMTSQFDNDQELKFKQTDLRSLMTELFVDLPMRALPELVFYEARKSLASAQSAHAIRLRHGYLFEEHAEGLNAAEFFVGADAKGDLKRIVLEGAPGQGKSTITQYVCQIMRMHLLEKHDDLKALPAPYQHCRVKIPFRVDLRDLAKWMSGVDPFQSRTIDLDEKEPLSLEGFLAGQVRFESGGHRFNVSDLTAVARASHIFLALDGFDEVADVELRRHLVTEITKGTTRLMAAGGFSVQAIVTSRPAAFAKSVRFPTDQWSYFELLALERPHVDAYTTKWMKAKGLKSGDQIQLRRLLDSKLREPHTQYLAKNPMQLTILLSLMLNRGASLPEKRTAMYDAYMDMFFSRESEKSDVVRDYRDLLIDIHRYLAWNLQTAAEAGESGSIEYGELRKALLLYLDSQGEDTAIVGRLFNGVIERVGALVSRVQETYEFEVQPLREYFAARHLYETAPYSPPGDERSGTKLDRFDALLKNPYWLNVARFYGGCFSKGEISALVDQLTDLAENTAYGRTSHPRSVAMMLLGDWVFTQYQPSVKRVINFIGQYPQLRQLLANGQQIGPSVWSALPDRSGRLDLQTLLWDRLLNAKYLDEKQAIGFAIVTNSTLDERIEQWTSLQKSMAHSDWILLGSMLNLLEEKNALISRLGCLSDNILELLVNAEQFSSIKGAEYENRALRLFLTRSRQAIHTIESNESLNSLDIAASISATYQYRVALGGDSDVSTRQILENRIYDGKSSLILTEAMIPADASAEMRAAATAYCQFIDTPIGITSASLQPWSDLVAALRGWLGDSPVIDRIPIMAAGIRSRNVTGSESRLANAADLVSAARFARLKSGAYRWWESRLLNEQDALERRRLLLLLWVWGTGKTLVLLSEALNEILRDMSISEWKDLYLEYTPLSSLSDNHQYYSADHIKKLALLGSRLCTMLGSRAISAQKLILAKYAARSDSATWPEYQFAMDAFLVSGRNSEDFHLLLPLITTCYQRGASAKISIFRHELTLSDDVAERISSDLLAFPLPLVHLADNHLRSASGANAPKLLDVSKRERWFE